MQELLIIGYLLQRMNLHAQDDLTLSISDVLEDALSLFARRIDTLSGESPLAKNFMSPSSGKLHAWLLTQLWIHYKTRLFKCVEHFTT